MLVILLEWIYIFLLTLSVGHSIKQLFKLDKSGPIITVCFGLFGITLFTGFWAIFHPINEVFQLILFILSASLAYFHRKTFQIELQLFIHNLKSLTQPFKFVLALLLILMLAQCASAPFLIDNESYYIQTIKWLNHYGFVPGLINLHIFLGQTSGWHILQAAFSFSFIYDFLNDLSGFCLMLGNIYAISSLNRYIKAKEKVRIDLIIGLFLILNIFFFQFIAAPSPDIAIYVLALIIFHQFILCFEIYDKSAFMTVIILSVFATFIKLTGLVFFVLGIILFFKYYIYTRKQFFTIVSIGALTLFLFAIKNLIITGNLIYPLAHIDAFSMNWVLPQALEYYFSDFGKASAYGLSIEAYQSSTVFSLIKQWILRPKLDGVFNGFMLLFLIISPLFIFKLKAKKALFVIYLLGFAFLVFLLFTVPEYRFYFPFLMLLLLVIISFLARHNLVIYALAFGAPILVSIPLFFSMNTDKLTETEYHSSSSTFSLKYGLEPHPNSRYSSAYETLTIENLILNTPTEIEFFWGAGNIPLPALNNQQLDYISTYFNIIPQMRGESLSEGFYSKNLLE